MRKHESMLRTGKVSIWVGGVESEEDLLSYVDDGKFGEDFDFEVNPEFGRELKSELTPVPIEQLTEGFSSWEQFSGNCVQRAKDLGFESANCMVVFYSFEYVSSQNVKPNAPLNFVGTFDF